MSEAKLRPRGGHLRPCCCDEVCRKAEREYGASRSRLIAYGRWQPFAPAAPVREHARSLLAAGMSVTTVARAAGVRRGAVNNLMYGHMSPRTGQREPARRVRAETAARIMAVRPALESLAAHSAVDATGIRRRLQALVSLGWTLRAVAGMVPLNPVYLSALMAQERKRPFVSAETARRVRALYDRMWDQVPPETTPGERRLAARARGHAAKRGWAPPLAWDDETIDDPQAVPAGVCPEPAASPPRQRVKAARREDGVLDEVAARAVAGGARQVPLTPAEQRLAVSMILKAGGGVSLISQRLRVSGAQAAQLAASAAAENGTQAERECAA
jgi:hypothetical protein